MAYAASCTIVCTYSHLEWSCAPAGAVGASRWAWQTNLKPFAKVKMRNQRIVILRSRPPRLCAHIAFARDLSVSWGSGATATSTNGACDASKRPHSARKQSYATKFRCHVAVLRCCQGCGAKGAAQTSDATGPRQQLTIVACRLAQGRNGSFARF